MRNYVYAILPFITVNADNGSPKTTLTEVTPARTAVEQWSNAGHRAVVDIA